MDASNDSAALAAAVRRGEREALAAALNLLDDRRAPSRESASAFLTALRASQDSEAGHLIGITGPPGVGKSSLSALLIRQWRRRELRVGVLAVDPSSPLSGGALLGDRLRMKTSDDDGVFVRSLSSRGEFGGLSSEVWPMSLVMLAAFDIVLIETVGVGQREVDVSSMCDTTCFVAQPGSGDSIQFLKAGILEVPHILVVNKEDMGDPAQRTLSELGSALVREHPDGLWRVPVLATSAARGTGIAVLADTLEQHRQLLCGSGALAERRRGYQDYWVHKRLRDEFGSRALERLGGADQLRDLLRQHDANPLEQYERIRQTLITNSD